MDIATLLTPLNAAQRAAVTTPPGSVLVLAGAGSGKTRVLVHRIAWLLSSEYVPAHRILVVTFTNKAANELRTRIETLIAEPLRGMWVGTFHGLAHRLLRIHWQEANLPHSFQILDSDDQYRLLKRIQKAMKLEEKEWPAKESLWFINHNKDEGLRPQHLDYRDNPRQQKHIEIYMAYEKACQKAGLVDFAELLLRAHELLRDKAALRQHYQERFTHLLVDEFQDTNAIQYAWLRLLAGEQDKLFVVGDDDQSIYGWRGACVDNLRYFQGHYPKHKLLRLEQNYRSTQTILDAANALISHNSDRIGKKLWTDQSKGALLSLYAAFNEFEEARYTIERIQTWHNKGGSLDEVAILYRSNAQSRLFEQALLSAQLPYRIYGGLRFFERAEIKDALAYLQLIAHPDSDPAFDRIVNTPPRGIGSRSLEVVRSHAGQARLSLWRAAKALCTDTSPLASRARKSLGAFLALIERFRARLAQDCPLSELVEMVLQESGLNENYRKEPSEKAFMRLDNLKELVQASAEQVATMEIDEGNLLESFLGHAALESGEAHAKNARNGVQLMTLHAAKGLEFSVVFISGMEEGLFPHHRCLDDPAQLQEERRLCYVGMTRAMHELHLSHAEIRRIFQEEKCNKVSRFVTEIPAELITEIRPQALLQRPRYGQSQHSPAKQDGLALGQRVQHQKFGKGVVLNREGRGQSERIQICFEQGGNKWLVTSFAKLQPLTDE